MKAMMFCVFDTKQQSPKFAEIMKKVNCWINSNHLYSLFHGLEYCMKNANSTQKILFIYQNTTQFEQIWTNLKIDMLFRNQP